MMAESPFLTVPEVAARWRLSERAVRDEIARKRLVAIKVGGQWLIKPADLETFEASQANVRQTPKRRTAPRRRVA